MMDGEEFFTRSRICGESILKMYLVLDSKGIRYEEAWNMLISETDTCMRKGLRWCKDRRFLNKRGITARGRRYIRRRLDISDGLLIDSMLARFAKEEGVYDE